MSLPRPRKKSVVRASAEYIDYIFGYSPDIFEIQDCNLRYCNEVMLFAISDFSPCTYIGLSNISPAKETNLTNVSRSWRSTRFVSGLAEA